MGTAPCNGFLLRGGRVIDPSQGLDGPFDVWVREGRIAALEPHLAIPGVPIWDATGWIVCPGFVDLHTHLREPGFEYKETIATGTAAAARGGFTCVVCMSNTRPPIDRPEVLAQVQERIRQTAAVRVFPMASLTWEHGQERLSDLASLTEAVAFTDDAFPVQSAALMRRGMEEAARWGKVVATHCEDWSLCRGGILNEGEVARRLGVKGWPAVGEEVFVARNVLLAAATGCSVHICHVSTAGSVEILRWAKRQGFPVSAEVCPHHFTLTEEAALEQGANAKVNPPLRTQRDVEALRCGLQEGVIDAIATDHAPHAPQETALGLEEAPFGLVGLETALGLVLTQLVDTGVLSLPEAIAKMSTAPARILGLPGGTLKVGAPADLTVFDPQASWRVEPEGFASQGRNTPFAGWLLRGKVMLTLVEGRPAYADPSLSRRRVEETS